jgi:peptidoglycan/xylan/chitin deacetylase (PgdA/CDA1 family)
MVNRERIKHLLTPIARGVGLDFLIRLSGQKQILPFYHAVTDYPDPHLKSLSFYRSRLEFEKDLDFILENYRSIGLEEVGKNFEETTFHLSFDDGLRECFHGIAPTLLEKKIGATFFINSAYVDNKRLFFRHKISLLLASLGPRELSYLADQWQCEESAVKDKILCMNASEESKLDGFALQLKIDFSAYLNERKPYLTSEEVIELHKMGFSLGLHGHEHLSFEQLGQMDMEREVGLNKNFLQNLIQNDRFGLSFPYGQDQISASSFTLLEEIFGISKTFGVSGLKKDQQKNHYHRIPMEINRSGEEIIYGEYLYFLIKSPLFKNTIRRR